MYKLNPAALVGSPGEKKDVDAVILGRAWDLAMDSANTAGRNQLTVLLNIKDHDIQRFPWFFRPPKAPGTATIIDTSKFDSASGAASHNSSSSNNNKNHRHYLRGPEFGFWTWPYFACSKISSTHSLNNINSNNNNNNNFYDNNTEHKKLDEHGRIESNNSNNHHYHHHNNGQKEMKVNGSNSGLKKGSLNGKRCDPVQGLFVVSYTAGFPMYQSRDK